MSISKEKLTSSEFVAESQLNCTMFQPHRPLSSLMAAIHPLKMNVPCSKDVLIRLNEYLLAECWIRCYS